MPGAGAEGGLRGEEGGQSVGWGGSGDGLAALWCSRVSEERVKLQHGTVQAAGAGAVGLKPPPQAPRWRRALMKKTNPEFHG